MMYYCCTFHGLIAQWIEHPPSKRVVVGSNPTQSEFFLTFAYMSPTIPKL